MPIGPITAKRGTIHKTGCTQHIVTAPETDRAMATGTCTKNLVMINPAVPEICLWTDTHTYTFELDKPFRQFLTSYYLTADYDE